MPIDVDPDFFQSFALGCLQWFCGALGADRPG